jgi:tRNA (cmo5U34)-methyltransferase
VTADWSFAEFGPQFDRHARAHLPHYDLATDLAAFVASYALPPGGVVADLGCSTGRSIERIAESMPERRFSAFAYDVDQSMLDETTARLLDHRNVDLHPCRLDLVAGDLEHVAANVTLALWTLQFLPGETWRPVLAAARQRASRDGVLLVAAKTRLPDARWQEIGDGAVAEWKARHDVTPDEALAKARSLRGTMLLATLGRLLDDVTAAGWSNPAVLFRWHAWLLVGAWAEPVRETPLDQP